MHELGIAQEMLKVALDYAAKNNAKRIAAFHVEMSAAADESEDSLRFHFEHLTRGTIAEGAHIEFTRLPIQFRCLDCANEFVLEAQVVACPHCSGRRVQPLGSDAFKLTSIDVD